MKKGVKFMEKELYLLLLKKDYLIFDSHNTNEGKDFSTQIAAILDSFASLGFGLDAKSIKMLNTFSEDDLTSFYNANYALLSEFIGNNVKHKVFYKNFPKVDKITFESYWIRATLHYLTASEDDYGFFNEDIKDFKRVNTIDKNSRKLHIISLKEGITILGKYFTELLEQKNAISRSNLEYLSIFMKENMHLINPTSIPFHENMGNYVSLLYKQQILEYKHLGFIKNITDILRIYASISNASALLEGKIKFISLPRKYRLIFIRKMDEIALNKNNIPEDMHRHEFYWKKALEKLHIGEYQQFDTINKYVKQFRNDDYETYYGNLEKNKNDQDEYLRLLSSRPGDFARRIDAILRNENYDVEKSLKSFENIASNISTTVLLQLWQFYKNRLPQEDNRIVSFNKNNKKIYLQIKDNRKLISNDIALRMLTIIEKTLEKIYEGYERIENVYVSPNMKNYALPTNSRNASSQTKTLTYGTRVPLNGRGKKYIRFFTHWKNLPKKDDKEEDYYDGRIDIDLSIELVSEDFKDFTSVAWHNIDGGKKFSTFHSGDIVTAPEGASEFVDLDYKAARKYYRYALVNNVVFSGQEFYQIPECFSGVMFLNNKGKKGDIFQASRVKHKFSLTQKESNHNVSYLIDLKTMELIWVDAPISGSCYNVVASKSMGILSVLIKDLMKTRMNFYDFLMLHKSHISFVDKKEKADFIISDEEDATLKPYDIETISSKWL